MNIKCLFIVSFFAFIYGTYGISVDELLKLKKERGAIDVSAISKDEHLSFAKKALNIASNKKIKVGKLKSGTKGYRGRKKAAKDLSNIWVIVNKEKKGIYFVSVYANIFLMKGKYFKVKRSDFEEIYDGAILKKYNKKYVASAILWKKDYAPAYIVSWKKKGVYEISQTDGKLKRHGLSTVYARPGVISKTVTFSHGDRLRKESKYDLKQAYMKYRFKAKILAFSEETEEVLDVDRKSTGVESIQDGYCYRFYNNNGKYERITTSPQDLKYGSASNVFQDILIVDGDVYSINKIFKEFTELPIQYSIITYLLRNVLLEENAVESEGAKITKKASKRYQKLLNKIDITYRVVEHHIVSDSVDMYLWIKKPNKYADKTIQAENLILGAKGFIRNNPRLARYGYKEIEIDLSLLLMKVYKIKTLLDRELSLSGLSIK